MMWYYVKQGTTLHFTLPTWIIGQHEE